MLAEDARAHNLPAHLVPLVGRDEKARSARQRLLQTNQGLLTLTGVGGSGKTSLALLVAHQLVDHFVDGTWLVELAPLAEPALVPDAVASALGVREQPGRLMLETLCDALAEKSLLLVLDNCEHVIDACAELVTRLLESCSNLHILVTSREPLKLTREMTLQVPPLAAPAAEQLFVERAQAVRSDFVLTKHNAHAVTAICARLDGLPLAIELAAARARILTAEQIFERLDDACKLLVGGARTAPTRQQTLVAALGWSYDLLSPEEQRLFGQVSIYAGGFDLEATEAIHGPSVLPVLERLVEKSLVVAEASDAAMRFWLLEPVRQYAHWRLVERGDWDDLQRRHASYYLQLAERAGEGVEGPQQRPWMERLEREHDNLRAAMRRCLDGGDVETTLRIGSALWLFWRQRGHRMEGERWLEEGLARASGVPPAVRAKALRQVGELANAQSDYRRGADLFREALELWRELGDVSGMAGTLLHYGRLLSRLALAPEERQHAVAMLEESLVLYGQLGQHWGMGWALQYLGVVAYEAGDLERAEATLLEGKRVLEEGGGHHLRSHVIDHLGGVMREKGDFDLALRLLDESLAESRATHCDEGAAGALYRRARLARSKGDRVSAATDVVESLDLNYKLALRPEAADCLELLAGLACDRGQAERALRLFAAAVRLRSAVGVLVPPMHQPPLERDVALARGMLSPTRSAAAEVAGRAMTFDEAVQYAREAVAPPSTSNAGSAANPLSQRERQVALLIARGWTNRQIADELVLSERTVDNHVARILARLGFTSRSQIAAWVSQIRYRD